MCVHITPSPSLKNNERKNAITHKRAFAHVHTYTHTCTRPHSFSLSLSHTHRISRTYMHTSSQSLTHYGRERERVLAREGERHAWLICSTHHPCNDRALKECATRTFLPRARAPSDTNRVTFFQGPIGNHPKSATKRRLT